MYVVINKHYREVYGPFDSELAAQTWIDDVCADPILWEVRLVRSV